MDGQDFGQPGVAALLGGFERGGLPFLDFFVLSVVIEADLGAFAFEWGDAGGADLSGFAHNGVHAGAFRERLAESDFVGERFDLLGETHLEHGGVFRLVGEFADPLATTTIEGDHGVTFSGAIHSHEMV